MTAVATLVDMAPILQGWLGPDVGVGQWRVARPAALWPVEAPAMVRAIPARRAEFAAGRAAARLALVALGRPAAAIPMGPDRAPRWPGGMCGSITHHDGLALAVASASATDSLGIDLTDDAVLPGGVGDAVAFGDERALPGALVFAAKEAAYKAFYPVTREVWGFDALSIRLTPQGFAARLNRPAGPRTTGDVVHGFLARHDGQVLAALRLPHRDPHR